MVHLSHNGNIKRNKWTDKMRRDDSETMGVIIEMNVEGKRRKGTPKKREK